MAALLGHGECGAECRGLCLICHLRHRGSFLANGKSKGFEARSHAVEL